MARRLASIPRAVRKKLETARVARLATVGAASAPHVVPVCFVYHAGIFYSAIDRKPKRVAAEKLARVRNLRASPRAALLLDHYVANWDRLWYVLVQGRARVLSHSGSRERKQAIGLLKKKYPPYRRGLLDDNAAVIRMVPERIAYWGRLS